MSFNTQTPTRRARIRPIRVLAAWMILLATIPSASDADQIVFLSETFDVDLGTATAVNDNQGSNSWQFRDDCAANALSGHSVPGTARWGNPSSCNDFGNQGSTDTLDMPAIDVGSCAAPTATLELSFSYFLDYQESASFDRARVEAVIDGGTTVVLADNGFGPGNQGLGNLVEAAGWSSLALDLTDLADLGDSLVVRFVGETGDGIANTGVGFLVDDIEIVCDASAVDMAVSQTATPDPVQPGRFLDYQITVTHEPLPRRITELYSIETSEQVGGPAFDFEDISTIGTAISAGDDQIVGPFPIGFDFPFFEADRTLVYVSSNGFLTFLAGQSNGCCLGGEIPAAVSPNAVVAAWWADLNQAAGGQVDFMTRDLAPNRRFIVQFTDVPHFPATQPVTFQVKLFESDGTIEIHYLDATSSGRFHTVGIEDDVGLTGFLFSRDAAVVATPLAVRFSPGSTKAAFDVRVVDVLPAESLFSSAVPSRGDCTATGVVLGETVTCELGVFEVGDTATIDIAVTVPLGVELPMRNTVTVRSGHPDADASDNTSSLLLPVEGSTAIFVDDFESGDTTNWSSTSP